jgi:hypothetical protein
MGEGQGVRADEFVRLQPQAESPTRRRQQRERDLPTMPEDAGMS